MYAVCLVVFPVLVTIFFTTLMGEGQPTEMPIGIVDLDCSATSRSLSRRLDAFQTSRVVARYESLEEARKAVQRGEIYGFFYIPRGMSDELLSNRQPKVSYYYTMTTLTAGSLVFRDMKTISLLGSAAVGQAIMRAKGATDSQTMAFLQPITVDLHQISNPYTNYSVYLSTMLIPGVMMLFMFLVTAYSLGMELKFNRSRQWLHISGDNIVIAVAGKMLPQTLTSLIVVYGYMLYVYGFLGFPCPGGYGVLLLTGLLMVLAAEGFGLFIFSIMPSMRMSMSVCSLWAVLSFSMVGTAFPVFAMDSALQSLSWLFPLRHYFVIYQTSIFNDYPLSDAWWHVVALVAFASLPILILPKLHNAMKNYVYIP
ncbi:MAG: ABC transporter permease [Prevotella sp.]